MTLLTIFLPNYNYLSGFKKNYEQICLQKNYDKRKVSVLISDDSSDGAINEFYQDAVSSNKQYTYVIGPKLGAVPNWNECLDRLGSEYAMFLHHDEYIASEFFIENILKICETKEYDLIILPLRKKRNERMFLHYPKILKFLFVVFPFLLYSCNPFGSPSVIIFRSKLSKRFDKNLRWMVDVEWYYQLLKPKPKLLLLSGREYEIISNLDFTETETNDMDVSKLIPVERDYISKKHGLKRYVFHNVWKSLKIPVKIYEWLSA